MKLGDVSDDWIYNSNYISHAELDVDEQGPLLCPM